MDPIIYTDVIGNISVSNGMLRMDLYTEVPVPAGQQKEPGAPPKYVVNRQLVMPLTGFLQSYTLFHGIVQQLEKEGAISVNKTPTDQAGEEQA